MTASAINAAQAHDAPFTAPLHWQLAALCYRKGAAGREVLLVTSSSGRWILPKGWPIADLKPGQTAMVEAWEEAGVRKGKVARKPLGAFMGSKFSLSGDEEPCLTEVYAVKVEETLDAYPEVDKRDRVWVSVEQAQGMVLEDGLRAILARF